MLNGSVESKHPCLVPDCRGKAFSLLLLCMMLAVGLLYNGLYYVYYVRCISSIPNVCQMVPLQLLRWSFGFFFHSINVIYHNDWFAYIKPSLHPRYKSYLSMMSDPFNMMLNLVCKYFGENFCICIHQRY